MSKKCFHDFLRDARLKKGFTLRQLAAKTGNKISNPHISQLERGIVPPPSPSKIWHLSRALKVSYEEMMYQAGYLTKKDAGKFR